MPAHADRVRRNYACPHCDGTGQVDDYEGVYPCSTCDGTGILLTPLPTPTSALGSFGFAVHWITREALEALRLNLTGVNLVVKR